MKASRWTGAGVGVLAATVTVVASSALAAGHPGVAGHAATAAVHIKNIHYRPPKLTIHRGQTVTWHFDDEPIQAEHNVTSIGGRGARRFHGSPTKLSGTYSVRFTRPGIYRYMCTVHDSMHGEIIVR